MTFRSLMCGHNRAEIRCLYSGNMVRRLAAHENLIEVDALTVKVSVPLDTEISFDPRVLDRGDMLFNAPGNNAAKLCTEGDRVLFDDGTETFIYPPASGDV